MAKCFLNFYETELKRKVYIIMWNIDVWSKQATRSEQLQIKKQRFLIN